MRERQGGRRDRRPLKTLFYLRVRVSVKENETNYKRVNGEGFNEGESQNHCARNFAAYFGIAGDAFAGAFQTHAHTDSASASGYADAKGCREAGNAHGTGIERFGCQSHARHTKDRRDIEGDHSKFTHSGLLVI